MPYRQQIEAYVPSNEQEANDQRIILNYIDSYSDSVLTRGNEIAHMTSSGLILNRAMDKVLMIHHNIYGTWAWTGGHADGDRDMLVIALKEAQEETGIRLVEPLDGRVASIDILTVNGHHKRGKYVSSHLHLNTSYVLIADESDTLVVNEEETSGVRWIDADRLHEYSNEPYMVEVYKKIIAYAHRHKR